MVKREWESGKSLKFDRRVMERGSFRVCHVMNYFGNDLHKP